MSKTLTIWCNAGLPASVFASLESRLLGHTLVISKVATPSNLVAGAHDPVLEQADVAFGQPDPQQVVDSPNLKWVHLTSAGYTRYDTAAVREALANRGGILTNSSSVYDEPCAEHTLAFMMANARQLGEAFAVQSTTRGWPSSTIRIKSKLMFGQSVIIYGFGAIANRLVELLAPFKMNIVGVRRQPRGDEPIKMVTHDEAEKLLGGVDQVINILPASPETERYFDARRLSLINPQATYYNIGRGSTTDSAMLQAMLVDGKLAAAYLDVTDPEPLPPSDPLWTAPRCYITPHTAGGHAAEFEQLADHFAENLKRYHEGTTMRDVVFGK